MKRYNLFYDSWIDGNGVEHRYAPDEEENPEGKWILASDIDRLRTENRERMERALAGRTFYETYTKEERREIIGQGEHSMNNSDLRAAFVAGLLAEWPDDLGSTAQGIGEIKEWGEAEAARRYPDETPAQEPVVPICPECRRVDNQCPPWCSHSAPTEAPRRWRCKDHGVLEAVFLPTRGPFCPMCRRPVVENRG